MPFQSAIYVALSTILVILLALRVSKYRRKFRIGIGSGDQLPLDLAIRVHANAVENLPMALLLLCVAEASGLPLWATHLAGATIVISRVMHAWGLSGSQGVSFGRFYGALLCWGTMLLLAAFVIVVTAMSVLLH